MIQTAWWRAGYAWSITSSSFLAKSRIIVDARWREGHLLTRCHNLHLPESRSLEQELAEALGQGGPPALPLMPLLMGVSRKA